MILRYGPCANILAEPARIWVPQLNNRGRVQGRLALVSYSAVAAAPSRARSRLQANKVQCLVSFGPHHIHNFRAV